MNELTNRQLETLGDYLLEQEGELPRWFKNLRARYRNGKVSESVVDAKCWGILPAELYYSISRNGLVDLSQE